MTPVSGSAAWLCWSIIVLFLVCVIYQQAKVYDYGSQLIIAAETRFSDQRTGVWKRRWIVKHLQSQIFPLLRFVFTEAVLEQQVEWLYEDEEHLAKGRSQCHRDVYTAHTRQFYR